MRIVKTHGTTDASEMGGQHIFCFSSLLSGLLLNLDQCTYALGPELFIYVLGPALSGIYIVSTTTSPVILAATQFGLHSSYVTLPRGFCQPLCYDMDTDLTLTDWNVFC